MSDPVHDLPPAGTPVAEVDPLLEEIPDSEIWDIVTEETPGFGRLKRLYRYVKRNLAREYITEIRKLKRREDALIATLRDQTTVIHLLRQHIKELENQLGGETQPPPGPTSSSARPRASRSPRPRARDPHR